MRHRISGNKLNRNQSLRKATVRDIAKATLIQQRICTTKAKAKEARKLVDKLITLGKKGTLADKRRAFAILCDHKVVSDLFNKTSPRFNNRMGGYTRIILLHNRRGDNAQLAFLELTEKEEVVISKPKSTASKKDTKAGVKPDLKKDQEETKKVATATALEDAPKESSKESSAKKDAVKDVKSKKGGVQKDKGKKEGKLVGGLRKMFKRKAS